MAQLGKFEITRQDGAGNPVIGATITIRKQGATVQSGGPTSFTVDDPGGILNTDSVNVYNADGTDPGSPTVSVSSHTASNVTVGSALTATNNTRLSPSTSGPTIYADAQGNETKTLTTDSNGYATGWVEVAAYDVVSTGGTSSLGSALTKVWFDVFPSGHEKIKSNDFFGGSTTERVYDTIRSLTSGDKFVSYKSAGTEKWYVDLTAGLLARVPSHAVAGMVTIETGGLTITAGTLITPAGGLTITGTPITLTGSLVIAGTLTGVTTASLSSDLTVRRLLTKNGTDVVAGDFVASAGWGNTPAAVITVGSNSNDTSGSISVFTGTAGLAANPTITLTFKDGTFTNQPVILVTRNASVLNAPTTAFWASSGTATTAVFTFVGTPGASLSYALDYHVLGI